MHSVVTEGTNSMSNLHRTTKRGEMQMVEATVNQICAVADDLHRYFSFARALANCIAVKLMAQTGRPGTIVVA